MIPSRPWPWRESPSARLKRVALSYRAALDSHAPAACRELDSQMRVYGQFWLFPRPITHGPDDPLTASEAADYASVTPKTIYAWVKAGLPSTLGAGGIRVRFSDLRRWLDSERHL